jgi:signal transduction histidine kinase
LLGLARVTRLELQPTPVDLSAMALAIMEELRAAGLVRQVEFVCASKLRVHTAVRLMRMVLQNLLGDAWRFTSKHAVARIEARRTEPAGQSVYFVRDDGAGEQGATFFFTVGQRRPEG